MKPHKIKKTVSVLAITGFTLLSGCATYYSHFGMFDAQNSKGEERQFRVSWETEEYPSWAPFHKDASKLVLETQCSTRKWVFRDPTFGSKYCSTSAKGIVSCGNPALDLKDNQKPVTTNNTVCASVTDVKGSSKIADLDNQLLINMKCRPASTTYQVDGKKKNRDYLMSSVVPYSVATTKVERYSFQDVKPKFSYKACPK